MQIGCTKKLLDYLNNKGGPVDAAIDPLFSWSANLITLNRRRTIVAANDYSRYGFVLYGVKTRDVKSMNALMLDGVRACLQTELIDPVLIDEYMSACGGNVTYTKTPSRQTVARLNRLCSWVEAFTKYMNNDRLLQLHILPALNYDFFSSAASADGRNHVIPYELLVQGLSQHFGRDSIRCRAIEFEVELELETPCTRRIIAPSEYTFRQFHQALQCLFCWKGYHLHDFWIERYPNGQLKKTIIGQEREDEYEGETTRMDTEVKLSEIFPKYGEIIYNYDFGDDWVHHIRFIREIEDYDKNYPVCLSGEGDAPPEDVGGPDGFADMLRILSDPKDPEYKSTKTWSEGMYWKPFNLENSNRKLRYSIRERHL